LTTTLRYRDTVSEPPSWARIGDPGPRYREGLAGRLDLRLGRRTVRPPGALDRFAGLEFLVDLEEVLDLEPVEFGHVVDVLHMLPARIRRGHAKYLVVEAILVPHPEHPDHPAGDQAAREGGLLEEHERVERVAVVGQGVFYEAVVGRVPGGGEQHAVQPDPPGLVVHLVLVALPLGNFDGDLDVHGFAPSRSG
jgi:hypothetical protein